MRTILLAIICALLLISLATHQAHAACGAWGRVVNITPNRTGASAPYWISIHLDAGGWTSFPSQRAFAWGQRVWVWGCPTLPGYIQNPWVW